MSDVPTLFAAAALTSPIDKEEYEQRLETLRVELLNNQFELGQSDFSVVVLIIGHDQPGCTDAIHALHEWLDSRLVDTHAMFEDSGDSQEDRERPIMWRYWRRLPRDGRIGFFMGAWVSHLIGFCLEMRPPAEQVERGIAHAQQLERALAQGGDLLLKYWLYLPKDELQERLTRGDEDPETHWEHDERDWKIFEQYDEGLDFVEEVVRRTDTPDAPWTIIDSRDRRTRNLAIAQSLNEALTRRLAAPPSATATPALAPDSGQPGEQLVLDTVDLSATLEKDEYERLLDEYQSRLNGLARTLWRKRISCVMAFEGWDAAGKGGVIRRLTRPMPIRGVRVLPIAAPSDEERAHHYLWRFWRHIPLDGRTQIFDRSWYGRVLVERVEGLASEAEWSRAYGEINDFEAQLVEHGTPVLKFWLHIDPEEQMQRFEARAQTPYKKHKLTEEDLRNREQWPAYRRAVHDMVVHTSTKRAPWHLIAANDKRWARIEVLRIVCEQLEARIEAGPGKLRKHYAKSRKAKKAKR
jgi:polyphosphate:AMP phosphotransferase